MTSNTFKSPVYNVTAVPFEKIVPNTYNPNNVAPPEMKLLYDSIREDGYTMPIVCYYSPKQDIYAIVDGFHRWRVMKEYPDIYEREHGMMPVTVIDKPLANRMGFSRSCCCLVGYPNTSIQAGYTYWGRASSSCIFSAFSITSPI